jgi:hypothetical protein
MKWLVLAIVLVIVAQSACDGSCVDGVCPSLDLEQRYPGPCESAVEGEKHRRHCTYSYEDARLVQIACSWWNDVHGDDDRGEDTTTWSYDASGQPVRVEEVLIGRGYRLESLWQLDTDPITYSTGDREIAAYDRETFAFLPMPGAEALTPRAALGLLRTSSATFTWSGSGTSLTRTGSDGLAATFELDDRQRVVRVRGDAETDGRLGTYENRWTFDGDVLVRSTWTTSSPSGESGGASDYVYDRYANLVTGADEVYGYDCW